MKRRMLSIITALALLLTLCPVGVLATGDTGETASYPVLPADMIKDVTAVEFEGSLNKAYDGTPVDATLDDLLFQVGATWYAAPTDTDVTVTPVFTWYDGETVNPDNLRGDNPRDAGTYTLHARVTLSVPDEVTPDPNPDPDDTVTRATTGAFTATLRVRISPLTITPVLSKNITKAYDGTVDLPSATVPSAIDKAASGICPGDEGNVDFTGDFHYDETGVGKRKFYGLNVGLSGSGSGNYRIEGGTVATLEVDAEITKATAPSTNLHPSRTIRNGVKKTYTFAIEDLLPALPAGQRYGTVTVVPGNLTSSIKLPGYFGSSADSDLVGRGISLSADGKDLILEVSATTYKGRQDVGTISFEVQTTNFYNFSVIVDLWGSDKTQLLLTGLETNSPEYDGKPQEGYKGKLEVSLVEENPNIEFHPDMYMVSQLTHSYVGIQGTTYGPTSEKPIEPGRYEVTLSIPESDPDFEGRWADRQFTITKATVTVKANDRSIKVDDPVPTFSRPVMGEDEDYVVLGLAEGDELSKPPTMKYATVADAIMPGEFDILIDGAQVPDTTHYNAAIRYVNGKLKVTSLNEKEDNPFSDVSEYAWYVTAVKYVYNNGLMKGVSNTRFDPTGRITRGMLVTILYRMENEPKVWNVCPFTDVKATDYYLDPIRWASSERIINGYGNGRFGPDDTLTREQLAIILYNYSVYRGVNVNKAASLDGFVDSQKTSGAGYRALQWACAEKLIQGTGSTTLSPTERALRAQVAVILMRYCTNISNPFASSTDTTTPTT